MYTIMELISNNLVISRELHIVLVLILLSHYGILEVRGKLITETSPCLIFLSHNSQFHNQVNMDTEKKPACSLTEARTSTLFWSELPDLIELSEKGRAEECRQWSFTTTFQCLLP